MRIYRKGRLFDKWRDIAQRDRSKKNNKAFGFAYFKLIQRHFRLWKIKVKAKVRVERKYLNAKKSVTLMRKRFFFGLLKKTLKRSKTKM
jgi:hypothetical protein